MGEQLQKEQSIYYWKNRLAYHVTAFDFLKLEGNRQESMDYHAERIDRLKRLIRKMEETM